MTQGLCWLGGSLSFFEEHTTAVCVMARLRIQRRRLLRLPTITTLRGRRRVAAESGTRKCPWRAEAWSPGGGPTPPMGEAMACTAPHTRPRVGATTRPRSTTVSRVCWTRCQPLACNAKRALHGSKAQRLPRSLSRNRAAETDRSPAIGQRSYTQPLIPAAPAPIAPSCSSFVPMSAYCFPEVRSPCSTGFWFPKSLESWLRLFLVYCNTKDKPLQTSAFPINLRGPFLTNYRLYFLQTTF